MGKQGYRVLSVRQQDDFQEEIQYENRVTLYIYIASKFPDSIKCVTK